MGTFEQVFAEHDIALISALGDDGSLDVAGDGTNVVSVKGLFVDPVREPQIGTLRTDIIEPHYIGRTVDLSIAVKGVSILTVSSQSYDVVDLPPPADGITVLVLRPRT